MTTGCEDFLDTKDLTHKNTTNYPGDETEMNDLLSGLYYAAHNMEMEMQGNNMFVISEFMSDDRFAGGAPDDDDFAKLEQFMCDNYNFLAEAWRAAYMTVFRANYIINAMELDIVNWTSEENRDYAAGQAYFLRAYAFFYLARMFGEAPMPLMTDPQNLPKSTADELFAQIGSDFKAAIELMPANEIPIPDRVRATKWAAEAFMARAWMFYTGYYGKTSMPLAEGGEITKTQVIGWLDDCINNSGHKLLDDFRSLWPYCNELTAPDYPYAAKNELEWIGEKGANTETVFAFSSAPSAAGWGNISSADPSSNANRINLYFSMRIQPNEDTFPFGTGWGFGTVNPQLWNTWPDADVRKRGSIADVTDPDEMPAYSWGMDNQMHETGYIQKKYICINAYDNGAITSYSRLMYGTYVNTDYQLSNTQDLVTMRFADVLLMAAELKEDVSLINKVRARTGLDDLTAYSLDALKQERRWELAFESVRYYDLLRWGDAATALATQNGVNVQNAGVAATMALGDVAAGLARTGGFFPIPAEEITKSEGVLTQSKGWGN